MLHSFIPHHKSNRTWQWWSVQVGPPNEINQGHKEISTYPEWQRECHTKTMDLWIVCSAYKHERAHWWWYINGKRIYNLRFKKIEAKKWSSTETDIVSVDDCMPDILWTRYWLDAQGCDFFENIFFQDNKLLLFWKSMASIQAASAQKT